MLEACQDLRKEIESVKVSVVAVCSGVAIDDAMLDGANLPTSKGANIKANLTLAFRHLEDARMRVGKAMQAIQGGISILDRKEP